MEKKLKFLIYGKDSGNINDGVLEKIESEILKYGWLIDKEIIFSDNQSNIDFSNTYNKKNVRPDFLISIGGDGTFIRSARIAGELDIPVIGINLGRLGFLADLTIDDIEILFKEIFTNSYSIEVRSMLELETLNSSFNNRKAINEISLHKKDSSAMMTIHTRIDGEYLNSYWADGIMISTPTGSTGYSLSCGGPIVVPQSESLVITPIAPHNLNVRPIVVSDKNVISLEVEGRSQRFMATLDSRSATIDSGYQLAIRKENYCINLIRLSNENFLNTLRKKLNWGLDTRN